MENKEKTKTKTLPILPNRYYSVSDHYFAALVTVRAIDALERCQSAWKNRRLISHKKLSLGVSRISNMI